MGLKIIVFRTDGRYTSFGLEGYTNALDLRNGDSLFGCKVSIIMFRPQDNNVLSLFCSEPMWPIEARCASIANNYFTVAINRIGTVSADCFNPFFFVVFL